MILRINPAEDVFTAMEVNTLANRLYGELSLYKDKAPTREDLKQTESRLIKVFQSSLFAIGQKSYLAGCKETGVAVYPSYLNNLHTVVKDRSKFAANSIVSTTALAFGEIYAALGKSTATSKKRSKGIADYEGNRIFFEQRSKAWRLKAGLMKSWYPTSDNVCPLCEDNEEDGAIPITEEFASGDLFPPGHFGCLCYVGITL